MGCETKQQVINKVRIIFLKDLKATNTDGKTHGELVEEATVAATAYVEAAMANEVEAMGDAADKAVELPSGVVQELNAANPKYGKAKIEVQSVDKNDNVYYKYTTNGVATGKEYSTSAKGITLDQKNADDVVTKYSFGNTEDSDKQHWNTYDRLEKVHGNIEGMKGLLKELHEIGGAKATDEHYTYLEGLFDKMDQGFFEKMNTYISLEADKSAGIATATSIGLKVAKGPNEFAEDMTDAEVYAHEVIHSMTMFALKDNSRTASTIKRQLEYAMETAMESMTWKDFLPAKSIDAAAEEKAAKDKFNYIFQGAKAKDEFIAHALTNPTIMAKLKTIKLKERKDPESVWDRMVNLFSDLMDIISGSYSFKGKHSNIFEQTTTLAFQLAAVNKRTVNTAYGKLQLASKLWDNLQKFNMTSAELIEEYWSKYMDNGIYTKPPKNGWKRALWMAKVLGKMITNNDYRKAFKLILSGYGLRPEGDIQTIFRDFFKGDELTQEVDMLALASDKIDAAKVTIMDTVASLIHKGFNRKITKDEEAALTRVLLDTDMVSISDKFTDKTLSKLLRDKDEVARRISRVKHKLKTLDPKNYNWNTNQGSGLGYFMVTNEGHIAQNINATNIASGVMSSKRRKPNAKVVKALDELATLTALSYTKESDKALIANLMKDNRAGVENIMRLHSNFIKEAKDSVFKDSTVNMIKGYTKELFDDKVTMTIAPVTEKANLEKEGYVLTANLEASKYDTSGVKMAMYIAESYETADYYRNATRLTSTKSRGTSITDLTRKAGNAFSATRAEATISKVDNERRILVEKIEKGELQVDKTGYGLMPILDSDGHVTDYRYMMSKLNKEKTLGQDLKVSKVLSHSFAHTLDKSATQVQNEKVLDIVLNDMEENYIPGSTIGKNQEEYILITKDSPHKGIQELYKVLPPMFKDAINNTESKGLAVRADLFHNYFGYRHASLAHSKLLQAITPKVMLRILKLAERMWMEFIKLSKVDILIKMPAVMVGNVVSNIFYAFMTGSSPAEIISAYTESIRDVNLYFKRHQELMDLELASKTGNVLKQDLRKIEILKQKLSESPIHELAELGIYQSIVEDMSHKEVESTNKIKKFMDDKMSGMPTIIKEGANMLYLTEGTGYYKFMNAILTKSDLVARDVENRKLKMMQEKQANGKMPLPKWYVMKGREYIKGAKYEKTTKRLTGKAREEFLEEADKRRHETVLNAFINYNKPSGKIEEYLNRMGAIMFTKYAKRIQRIISETSIKNPINVAAVIAGEAFLDVDAETIADQSIMTRSWYSLGLGPGDMMPGTSPFDRIMEVINPPLVQLLSDRY